MRVAIILGSASLLAACESGEPTVQAMPPASISVTIDQAIFAAISRCETLQLTATVRTPDQRAVLPDSLRWSSNDPAAASVTSSGSLKTLVSVPSATVSVRAYLGALSAQAAFTFAIPTNNPFPCQ